MLTDSMTLEHLTDHDIASARDCMLKLLRNDDAIGPWTDKTEVRQTGCSIHIKYGNKVPLKINGYSPAAAFVLIMLQAPDKLWELLVKLFAVGDEDMAALLEEARTHA